MKHLITAILFLFTTFAQAGTPCSDMVFSGVFPTASEPTTLLCHKRYVVGYSTLRHAPLWVAEVLTKENVANENVERKDHFRPDPLIPASDQAAVSEFVGTGYDKGHMVSFEDLADDAVAGDESFLMTNMLPQAATNNRQIWRSLEGKVRKLAVANGVIYVVSGPIFDGEVKKLKKGAEVPTRLWKMVIVPSTNSAFTVILPNVDGLDTSTLPTYLTGVRNLQVANPLVNPLPVKVELVDKKNF
jgi:endonuclease G